MSLFEVETISRPGRRGNCRDRGRWERREKSVYKERSKQLEYRPDQQENQPTTTTASNNLSFSIPLYIFYVIIIIMKFNIGMLFALAATTHLAAAAPVPQWNGKNAEAAYVPKSHDSQDQ
jgi:hypothetical protein